ncbi:JAB domain-containing protein [Enterocloster lavalensis]|uniref:RadC-like JAB domain-containing protein n=1 Tax=Enterocloster lavalensis TaxID=460384 RepID=A0A1I0KEL7_9FIRM|nr:JAB domain-containing protein [Enterocloster lavalensis]SEU22780.1 RadC-like JAB domain-containing protein [Enterocloster lavalensis]
MVLVLSLNTKLEPQAIEIAAVGGLNSCVVDVKNIFKHSNLNNAAYVACIHNHPSGDAEPSREDVLLTQKISAAGKILGLPLLDHIIVGEYGYYSFKEQGKLEQVLPDDAA